MAEESSGAGYIPVPVIVEPADENPNNEMTTTRAQAETADASASEGPGDSGQYQLSTEKVDGAYARRKHAPETDQSVGNVDSGAEQMDKKPGDSDGDLEERSQQGLEYTAPEQQPNPHCDQPNDSEQEEELLFPGFVPKTFHFLTQRNYLRFWCLRCITWPYPLIITTK